MQANPPLPLVEHERLLCLCCSGLRKEKKRKKKRRRKKLYLATHKCFHRKICVKEEQVGKRAGYSIRARWVVILNQLVAIRSNVAH